MNKSHPAVAAFDQAWQALETTYRGEARFADHLNRARLVGYRSGTFRIALPSAQVQELFTRRQEQTIVKDMLALYMPSVPVQVEFVVEGGQP